MFARSRFCRPHTPFPAGLGVEDAQVALGRRMVLLGCEAAELHSTREVLEELVRRSASLRCSAPGGWFDVRSSVTEVVHIIQFRNGTHSSLVWTMKKSCGMAANIKNRIYIKYMTNQSAPPKDFGLPPHCWVLWPSVAREQGSTKGILCLWKPNRRDCAKQKV